MCIEIGNKLLICKKNELSPSYSYNTHETVYTSLGVATVCRS